MFGSELDNGPGVVGKCGLREGQGRRVPPRPSDRPARVPEPERGLDNRDAPGRVRRGRDCPSPGRDVRGRRPRVCGVRRGRVREGARGKGDPPEEKLTMEKKKYEKPRLFRISIATSQGATNDLCIQGWGDDMIRPLDNCKAGGAVQPNRCTDGSDVGPNECITGTGVQSGACSGGSAVS